jgi:hypothetical protein
MKHMIIIGIVLGSFLFCSCDKEWQCTCKDVVGNTTELKIYKDVSKKEARKSCDELEDAYTDDTTCNLN